MRRKPNNPRRISKREYARLQADLERFGDLGGVVHNATTDNIVGGNQRSSIFDLLQSGAEISISETYDPPTRTGTVARGYIIWRGEKYDYRRVQWDAATEDAACLTANLRGGGWDGDVLAGWDDGVLEERGFDADLLDVWNDAAANLREMLAAREAEKAPVDAGAQVDRAEEFLAVWGVKQGDVWEIPSKTAHGVHRVVCGDCTDVAVVALVMVGEKADAVVTDPPYGIDFDTDYTRFTAPDKFVGVPKNHPRVKNDDKPFCPIRWLDYKSVVLFGANFYAEQLPVGTWLVWDKRFENGKAWLADAELAWMKGGKGVYIFSLTSQGMIRPEKVQHPTQKPVALFEWCFEKSKAGNIVLDPFLGSGTTLVACERQGRLGRGIEIAPEYVAVTLQRLQDLGLAPVRVATANSQETANEQQPNS